MLSPCWTKKVGIQFTKPKIRVLMVMSTTAPTTMRGSSAGLASEDSVKAGTGFGIAGGGNGLSPATSFSIARINASASSVLPLVSSQRGDSGSFLRRYQTTRAPMPAITNIGRQPKFGMMSVPSSEVAGKPETTTKAMKAIHLPRRSGGTNSVMVE